MNHFSAVPRIPTGFFLRVRGGLNGPPYQKLLWNQAELKRQDTWRPQAAQYRCAPLTVHIQCCGKTWIQTEISHKWSCSPRKIAIVLKLPFFWHHCGVKICLFQKRPNHSMFESSWDSSRTKAGVHKTQKTGTHSIKSLFQYFGRAICRFQRLHCHREKREKPNQAGQRQLS